MRWREHGGENQYHAIFDNDRTAMVHASTPATALVAYDASVELAGGASGSRVIVALRISSCRPKCSATRDARIEPGEVLTRVIVPPLTAGTKAAYHKQTERDSYDWPICDVAVVLPMERPDSAECFDRHGLGRANAAPRRRKRDVSSSATG